MTLNRITRITALALAASLTIVSGVAAQITFEDVFDAPDDQDLNLAYARQEADAGRLLGAAAALERMLYSNANWDSARLFYAHVLTRLDDRQGALREVELLKGRPLTPEQSASLVQLQANIERLQNGGSVREVAGVSGQIALAARYDDNAGSVFGDIVFGGRDRPDESVVFNAMLQYTGPVGEGATTGYVRGEMANRRHEDISDADYDVYGLAAGLRGEAGDLFWDVEADADFVDIASRDYLDQWGLSGRLGVDVSETVSLAGIATWHDQSFSALPSAPAAGLRTGDIWELGPQIDWRPSSRVQLVLTGLYQDKSAKDDTLAYDGWKLQGEANWQMTPDVYARGLGIYRTLDYKADSPFVFPAGPRDDEFVRLRGAIGVRASALLPGIPAMSNVTAEIAVNYTERTTNVPGSGFDNTGGEFRLTYGF